MFLYECVAEQSIIWSFKTGIVLMELHKLAAQVSPHSSNALKGLVVFVTHIKPSLTMPDKQVAKIIFQELKKGNNLGVRFILPRQGEQYVF